MTKVVYIGQYEEGVDLILPSGASKHAAKGEPIDVPQAIVPGLIEQGLYEEVGSAPVSKPAPSPAPPASTTTVKE